MIYQGAIRSTFNLILHKTIILLLILGLRMSNRTRLGLMVNKPIRRGTLLTQIIALVDHLRKITSKQFKNKMYYLTK